MASAVTGNGLPSGGRIFTTMPDILFIPEWIFGCLVWTLVASTRVDPANPQGWVMAVSIFCFIVTTLFFLLFLCGANQGGIWPSLDVFYHFIAVLFYLSASVALANTTLYYKLVIGVNSDFLKSYQENVSAVVFAYITTLLYFVHTILSALRWRSS